MASLLTTQVLGTASEWADANRILPPGNAEPGPWRSTRVPWFIQVSEWAANPRIRTVTQVYASQMSKTESLLNSIGHKLDRDPTPIIYIGPTKNNVDTVIEPRVDAMLRGCATLWARTLKGRKAQKLAKEVSGQTLRLGWAGSATELAAMNAALVVVDELDRMDSNGEGDPLEQARARTASYPDGQVFVASTPLVGAVETFEDDATGLHHWRFAKPEDVHSPIWRLWQEGTAHEWGVDCMGCAKPFIPRLRQLKWPKDSTAQQVRKTAWLECPRCQHKHYEKDKITLNESGKFYSQRSEEELAEFDHFSCWVSGVMSPWRSFGVRAAAFIAAVASKDQERIQAVINTNFGELYAVRGEVPDWKTLRKTCDGHYQFSTYPNVVEVPSFVQRLFITFDVQQNGLYWVIRGWGYGFRSALIQCGFLQGDTAQPHVWTEADELLTRRYGGLPIDAMSCDSNYRKLQAFTFCRRHDSIGFAIRGSDTERLTKSIVSSLAEINENGRMVKFGIKLFTVDSSLFKGWVHDHLNWPSDQTTERWEVPTDAPEDYCRQIINEQKITLPSGKKQWKAYGDNHYLDCEMQQVFLSQIRGIADLPKELDPAYTDTSAQTAERPKRESGYLSRGR